MYKVKCIVCCFFNTGLRLKEKRSMISQATLKQLLIAGLLLQTFAVKADIDESLWAGVEDAFGKIAIADAHFKSTKVVFHDLQADYSALLLNFDVFKAERQAAFACIKSSIEGLVVDLDAAIAYKAKVEYDAAVDQAARRAHIEAVRASQTAIINGLKAEKEALQGEIDYFKLDIATLEALNTEKVAQALIDIRSTGDSYRAMKVEREAFMTILDEVLAKAAAFESTQRSEMEDMGSFCND